LDLEKALIMERTQVEAAGLSTTSLSQELESTRRLVTRQEKYIEELEKDAVRVKMLDEDVTTLRRQLDSARKEVGALTLEVAKHKAEDRRIQNEVEVFLSAVKRSARGSEKTPAQIEHLFTSEHEGLGQDGLWARFREIAEEVAALLHQLQGLHEETRELTGRNAHLETQHWTLVGKLESTEAEYHDTAGKLREAQLSASTLDSVAASLREKVEALQGATKALHSELLARDRFLNRLLHQLSGHLGATGRDDDLGEVLLPSLSGLASPLGNEGPSRVEDFVLVQTSISTAMMELLREMTSLKNFRDKVMHEESQRESELVGVSVLQVM
jgi:chromosome segregation ATPase